MSDRRVRCWEAYNVIVAGDTDNFPAAKPWPSGWSGSTARTVETARRKTRVVSELSDLGEESICAGDILGDVV